MNTSALSKYFYPIVIFALVLFVPLFVVQQIGPFDFWWWMTTNLIILISLGLSTDHYFKNALVDDLKTGFWKKFLWGLISAVILYLVFYAGNFIIRQILSFADQNISNVYDFKGDASSLRIGLLMLLVIGPGEELFWRAYIQGNFMRRYGKITGFILGTLIYTLIHLATGNPVLILAALTGGVFWGWIYMKYQSITINIVSHIIWDISVFLLFPFY